jgi:hypothetical protein
MKSPLNFTLAGSSLTPNSPLSSDLYSLFHILFLKNFIVIDYDYVISKIEILW